MPSTAPRPANGDEPAPDSQPDVQSQAVVPGHPMVYIDDGPSLPEDDQP